MNQNIYTFPDHDHYLHQMKPETGVCGYRIFLSTLVQPEFSPPFHETRKEAIWSTLCLHISSLMHGIDPKEKMKCFLKVVSSFLIIF